MKFFLASTFALAFAAADWHTIQDLRVGEANSASCMAKAMANNNEKATFSPMCLNQGGLGCVKSTKDGSMNGCQFCEFGQYAGIPCNNAMMGSNIGWSSPYVSSLSSPIVASPYVSSLSSPIVASPYVSSLSSPIVASPYLSSLSSPIVASYPIRSAVGLQPMVTQEAVTINQPVTTMKPITKMKTFTTQQPVTSYKTVTTQQPFTEFKTVTRQQPVTEMQQVTEFKPTTTFRPRVSYQSMGNIQSAMPTASYGRAALYSQSPNFVRSNFARSNFVNRRYPVSSWSRTLG